MKRLEEEGIGRPSTYAPTVATIQRRGYVSRQGKALVPSFTAFAVTRLLRDHFGDYVDIGFTAEMEEILDKISNGEKDWLDFVTEFYRGDGRHGGLEHLVEDKGQAIEYPVIDVGTDPESGLPVRVRIGRYGPFLQLGSSSDEGPRASLPEDLAPADLTIEKAMALLKAKAQGPKSLGPDPKTGLPVYVMHGRFGAYVQLGETPERGSEEKPRRASLGRDYTEDTITLDVALRLLSLPRELGLGQRRRDDRRQRRPLRSVREAGQRVPLARGRRRRVHDHARSRQGAARAAEEIDAASTRGAQGTEGAWQASGERRAGAHPRRPLRSVRHRRHDQRVGAEGDDGRVGDDGSGAVELLAARAGAAPPSRRKAKGAQKGRGAEARGQGQEARARKCLNKVPRCQRCQGCQGRDRLVLE